jgi:hypothetical protein
MILPAARNLRLSLRRPSWRQACGGRLGATARIALARPATRPTAFFFRWLFQLKPSCCRGEGCTTTQPRTHNPETYVQTRGNSCRIPPWDNFIANSEPHKGTSLGPFVCGASEVKLGLLWFRWLLSTRRTWSLRVYGGAALLHRPSRPRGLLPEAGVPIKRRNKAPSGRKSGANGTKSNFELLIKSPSDH